MVEVHLEKPLCGLITSIPIHWFYVEKCKVRFSFQRPPYPGTVYWQSKLSATYWHSYVFQHSKLVLQEDLVFRDMIFNILETENEYPSEKDFAFSLFLGEALEPGQFSVAYVSRYLSWAESRVLYFCPPRAVEWCYLVLPQREMRDWATVSCPRTEIPSLLPVVRLWEGSWAWIQETQGSPSVWPSLIHITLLNFSFLICEVVILQP